MEVEEKVRKGHNMLFNPDISDMKEQSIRLYGNIYFLAKHYNVSRETIYQYLKRHDIKKKIIDDVRCYSDQTGIDCAEHVVRNNMLNYQEDPYLAQKAAEFTLNKKGHLRGWGKPEETGQLQNIRVGANSDLASGIDFPAETLSDSFIESPEHGD